MQYKCFCNEDQPGQCDSCEVCDPRHSPIALLVGAGLIAAIMFGLPWILAAGEVAFK